MRAFICGLFLLFTLCTYANTNTSNSLEVVAVDEPPANLINEKGVFTGIAVDVLKAMQQLLDRSSDIRFMPEARAINISRNDSNVILLSISRTPFREQHFYWIGPVLKKNWVVYTKKGSRPVPNLRSLKMLKSLGVVRGDVREEWLVNNKFNNLHSVTRHEQNLQMLLRGRTEAIVYEQFGMIYLAATIGLDMSAFTAEMAINQSDVYIVMSKLTPLEEVERWKQAYETVQQTDQLDIISKKWQALLVSQFNANIKIENGYLVL